MKDYFLNSSLFLIHKDTRIRRACLMLAESPENLELLEQFELEGPENYNEKESDSGKADKS